MSLTFTNSNSNVCDSYNHALLLICLNDEEKLCPNFIPNNDLSKYQNIVQRDFKFLN